MKEITVSATTEQRIRKAAIYPFVSTATKNDDGTLTFPVSDDVYERLVEHKGPEDTFEDVLLRAFNQQDRDENG